MSSNCSVCSNSDRDGTKVVRHGLYFRTSDGQWIQRYRCLICRSTFSSASRSPCFRQKKRQKNDLLRKLLCSGVSLRRSAKILSLHRTTVVRKFHFLSIEAEISLWRNNYKSPVAQVLEFDDLETFEHSKCKPLSVTLAVESGTRRILGLEVSSMPAKGLLVYKARKYGPRPDDRIIGRRNLFQNIRPLLGDRVEVKSDSNPHYPPDVEKFFPESRHVKILGKRGSLGGQGELKKVRFDPLFSLNHTCAKLRADVNRLIRKTWSTTKKQECLRRHLILYADYHNQNLTA